MKQISEVLLEIPNEVDAIFNDVKKHRDALNVAKQQLDDMRKIYSDKQSDIEKRLAEFMHLIELNNLTQKEINRVYKELHKTLIERRDIKDVLWAILKKQGNANFEIKTTERVYEYTYEPIRDIAMNVQQRLCKGETV